MPGLVPGIPDFFRRTEDVYGRAFARRSDSWKSSHKASARAGGTSPAMTLL